MIGVIFFIRRFQCLEEDFQFIGLLDMVIHIIIFLINRWVFVILDMIIIQLTLHSGQWNIGWPIPEWKCIMWINQHRFKSMNESLLMIVKTWFIHPFHHSTRWMIDSDISTVELHCPMDGWYNDDYQWLDCNMRNIVWFSSPSRFPVCSGALIPHIHQWASVLHGFYVFSGSWYRNKPSVERVPLPFDFFVIDFDFISNDGLLVSQTTISSLKLCIFWIESYLKL